MMFFLDPTLETVEKCGVIEWLDLHLYSPSRLPGRYDGLVGMMAYRSSSRWRWTQRREAREMAVGLHVAVAQVTGASSGIGEATARDLAVRGAAVDVTEPAATRGR